MLPRSVLPLLLLLFACNAGQKRKEGQAERNFRPPPLKSRLPGGTLHVTARETDFGAMLDGIAKADVVYVGESHDNPDHHEIQRVVVEYLYDRGRLHAIGMEMFFRPFQKHLDDYVYGRIDEATMLLRTEYQKRWGYDYNFYRPVMRFARQHRIPVIALNAAKEITEAVRKSGLDALDEKTRQALPGINLNDAAHRRYLRRIYDSHPMPKGVARSDGDFEKFYTSQCVWEDVMADSIVQWFRKKAPKDAQMVVLAGRGHLRYRYGVPKRAHVRGNKRYATIIPVEKNTVAFAGRIYSKAYADYVWITPKPKKTAQKNPEEKKESR